MVSVLENSPPYTLEFRLLPTDTSLQYFLLGEAGRFSLDQNTGVLTSRSNVDNEGEVFSLEVKVSDSGVPSLSDGGGRDRGRRPGGALHR